MTTQEFKETLIGTLTQRMTQRLIELAEASIATGVEEYIEKGYITLDFKGEFPSYYDGDPMFKKLLAMGLEYYDYRCVTDSAWAQMHIHLKNEGWDCNLTKIDGKDEYIVKMPSKLAIE